jgi:hypothetical protein
MHAANSPGWGRLTSYIWRALSTSAQKHRQTAPQAMAANYIADIA